MFNNSLFSKKHFANFLQEGNTSETPMQEIYCKKNLISVKSLLFFDKTFMNSLINNKINKTDPLLCLKLTPIMDHISTASVQKLMSLK